MNSKVACRLRVDEWHPNNVAKREHQAEAVGGDVDRGQDSRLEVMAIKDIKRLDCGDENNAVSDIAIQAVLLGDEGTVHQGPAEQARTKLHPLLDVDLANDWERDAWVELASNEPVIQDVTSHTADRKLAQLRVTRLNAEAADVDESSKGVGDDDIRGQDLDVVVGNESPQGEIGALGDSAGGADNEGEHARGEG